VPGPLEGSRTLRNAPTCEDLVERQFTASVPNELWLTHTQRNEAFLTERGERPSPPARRSGLVLLEAA
jgi:hypothetical protein